MIVCVGLEQWYLENFQAGYIGNECRAITCVLDEQGRHKITQWSTNPYAHNHWTKALRLLVFVSGSESSIRSKHRLAWTSDVLTMVWKDRDLEHVWAAMVIWQVEQLRKANFNASMYVKQHAEYLNAALIASLSECIQQHELDWANPCFWNTCCQSDWVSNSCNYEHHNVSHRTWST